MATVICYDAVPLKKRTTKKTDMWTSAHDAALREMTADGLCPHVMQMILRIHGRNPVRAIEARRRQLGIPTPRPI